MLPGSTRHQSSPFPVPRALAHGKLDALLTGSLTPLSVALFVAFVLGMAALPLSGLLAHTASDDAYYYLEIARRFGQSPWPTFDGTHVTTGFHPLWQALLIPVAWILDGHPWILVRVTVALSALLLLVAAFLFGRATTHAAGKTAGRLTFVLMVGSVGFARFGLQGMESGLALVFAGALLVEAQRTPARPLHLGLLCGLLALSRLEMAGMAGLVLLLVAWRDRSLRGPFKAGLVVLAMVVPYLAWNVAISGHAMTISSATKAFAVSSGAAAEHGGRLTPGFAMDVARALADGVVAIAPALAGGLAAAPLSLLGGDYPSAVQPRPHFVGVAIGALILLAAGLLLSLRTTAPVADKPPSRARLAPLVVLVVAGIGHLLMTATVVTGQAGPWYWGLEIAAVAATLGFIATLSQRWHRAVTAVAWANVLGFTVVILVTAWARAGGAIDVRRSFSGNMVQLAAAIRQEVPEGVKVGSCNAGTLGFVAERPIVNMDGLVNDWSLLEARSKGDVRGWMKTEGVRWFGDCTSPGGQDKLLRQFGLTRDDVTLVRRIDGGPCQAFLWHINGLDDPGEVRVGAR